MGSLELYVAKALLAWGITVSGITMEFYGNPEAPNGQAGKLEDGSCLIGVYQAWWDEADEFNRESLILHEVGHCAGLGHYGSCNGELSIMGCPNLGYLTGYDKAMVGYRVMVPMVAGD